MDPQTREAASEVYRLQMLFNNSSLEIKNSQGWLRYACDDWRHRLLGDITPDLFVSVGQYPTSVSVSPRFSSASEAREAVRAMEPRLEWVRAIASKISSARAFEKQPEATQAIRLMQAFVARKLKSDRRIEALEAAYMAASARLDRIERGKKSIKPKRSTSTQRK
jgi:hypothetical protein